MTEKESILFNATGTPVEELRFKDEVQIIRPSEAYEAMKEAAWQAIIQFENKYPSQGEFEEWFNSEVK